MQREKVARELEETECTLELATEHVSNQRDVVSRLESAGVDVRAATALLKTFEETFALYVEKRDRLREALARLD